MNDSRPPHVSIILLTYNGMPLVEQSIYAVLAQATPWPFEVIIIDSGSIDGTLDLVHKLPVRLVQISPDTFQHGRTRNLGAELAQGEYLVYLVQDAIPSTNSWLTALVAAAEVDGAAGSYCRQIPHRGSHPLIQRAIEQCHPASDQQIIKRLPPTEIYHAMTPPERFRLAMFTDTCSCIRRSIWLNYPFAELPYAEDIEWADRVLKAGYAIVYEGNTAVYHSHDRSAWYEFKRAYADHHFVRRLFDLTLIPSPPKALRAIAWSTVDSWHYLFRSHSHPFVKARLLIWAPFLTTAQVAGQYLGAHADQLNRRFPWFYRLDALLRRGV